MPPRPGDGDQSRGPDQVSLVEQPVGQEAVPPGLLAQPV
jgi:hypothetical protein